MMMKDGMMVPRFSFCFDRVDFFFFFAIRLKLGVFVHSVSILIMVCMVASLSVGVVLVWSSASLVAVVVAVVVVVGEGPAWIQLDATRKSYTLPTRKSSPCTSCLAWDFLR